MQAADERNAEEVFALFIAIAVLKHLETFDTAIYMLDQDSELE